jgi:hypothetical protein
MRAFAALKNLFLTPRTGRPQRRTRLAIESLEERAVPAVVTYHGGPLIANAQVEAVYYGSQWGDTDLSQTRSQLDGFLRSITNGPYMDQLKEYSVPGYDIGRGSFVGERVIDTSVTLPSGARINELASTLDDSDIRCMLQDKISNGTLAMPNANNLYIVFTPPNVHVVRGKESSVSDFSGYHDSFVDSAGQTVYYAVVVHQTGNTGSDTTISDPFKQFTGVTSHELAEAVTDPAYSGWFDCTPSWEIGDLAARNWGMLGGYIVQKEWSDLNSDQGHSGLLLSQATNFSAYAMMPNGNFFELGVDGNLWWRDTGDNWRLSDKGVTAIGVTGNIVWDLRTDHTLNRSLTYGQGSWIQYDWNVASFQTTGSNPWDIWDTHLDGSIYYNDGGAFVPQNPPPHHLFTPPPGHIASAPPLHG